MFFESNRRYIPRHSAAQLWRLQSESGIPEQICFHTSSACDGVVDLDPAKRDGKKAESATLPFLHQVFIKTPDGVGIVTKLVCNSIYNCLSYD